MLAALGGFAGANTVRLQADGKIIVGGYGNGGYFTLVRYLANGSPDLSFSGDGNISFVTANGISAVNDLTILSDGKILAVGDYSPSNSGRYGTSLMLARFNAN